MTKFSDPSWWPTAPLRPPKGSSAPMLVLGTLLPLVAACAVIVLVVTHRSHPPNAAAGRSVTAFEACMKDEGAESPSVSTNSRLLRLAAVACKEHLPTGMTVPDFGAFAGPALDAQQAFAQCIRSALAGLGGGGRFARPSRTAYENAVALCRHLTPGAPGQGRANA